MSFFDFQSISERKRFFWICFVVSLVVVVAATVFLWFTQERSLFFHCVISMVISVFCLDVGIVFTALFPNKFNRNYVPRFSMGKLRFERQRFPDDPEGLRFGGLGLAMVGWTLAGVMFIMSDYLIENNEMLEVLLFVFSGIFFLATLALIIFTLARLNKKH